MKGIKQIARTTTEIGLLTIIIAIGGFVLPIHVAPYLANLFSITTPYEAERQEMSISITNRNASHGETITLGVSNPASSVRAHSLSYSCDYPAVRLAYVQNEQMKEIPCGTTLLLPTKTQHQVVPLTSKEQVTYLPITITLEAGDLSGELSSIIAVVASNADQKSSLSDESTATLRSFLTQ